MVDLLRALDFGYIVRKALTDVECEEKTAALVHALIWLYCKCEIQSIVRVGKVGFHCAR